MANTHRPEIVEDQHLTYLDELRASGKTNMHGASTFIHDDFDVSRAEARIILKFWMDSYSERMEGVSRNESP